MALIEVKVPDIGDFKDVAVIELLVKPGDSVQLEQSLVTVESDKASMEIPSSAAGVVKELKVKLGDTVNEGSLLLLLEGEGAAAGRAGRGSTRRDAGTRRCAGRGRRPSRQLCRRRRPGMRHARARRRAGRLLGRFPRCRPGPEGGAGRALRLARRRVPERRLHPEQGAAARGRGDGRGEALRRPGRELRCADGRQRQAAGPQEQGGGQAHRRPGRDGQDAQGHGRARLRQFRRSAPCAGRRNHRQRAGQDRQDADHPLQAMHHRRRLAGRAPALPAGRPAHRRFAPARSSCAPRPSAC